MSDGALFLTVKDAKDDMWHFFGTAPDNSKMRSTVNE